MCPANYQIRNGMVPSFSSGSGVGTVWIVLGLSGTWRAEPNWIDREGRAMGVYWVTLNVVFGWSFYAA